MFNFASMLPSTTTTTMLPWMASTYTSLVMLRSMIRDFIPPLLQEKIFSIMARLYSPSPRSMFTLVIDEYSGCKINEMYEAAETYSRARINTPSLHRLAVSKQQDEKSLVFRVAKDEDVVDFFQGIPLTWKFLTEKESNQPGRHERRYFELIFCKRHKELVISAYLPHVMETSKAIMQENLTLRLYSYGLQGNGAYGGGVWGSIEHDHPATFDTLAMDEDLKKKIIQDLDRFLERREYYRRVGKAWKRGYLLYGPPGTGKSSLIAAIANYLNFNIYDVELTAIRGNAHLRNLLVATKNRSIIVIEDIDCSAELKDRRPKADEEDSDTEYNGGSGLTLSGLLSSIDGLWSSCGEERIIIFTTNHKDRIDPALLRPGRMDMHIHMSYCTASGFKILASNYLGLSQENRGKLYSEIADQIEESQITPAEVAEELMRSEDADTALAGLHECLKRKRTEEEYRQNQCLHEPKQVNKRRKVDDGNEMASITRMAGRRNVNHLRSLPSRMAGKGM